MIRVGIIGCGSIARQRHLPEYKANKDVEIAGFFNPKIERAKEMQKIYGGNVYNSACELFSDKSIDAVSICSSNATHAKYSIEALSNGKHVLCEKPMAITKEEVEQMVSSSEKSGKRLLIGQNQRITDVHLKVKEIIDKGTLGRVITFSTTFGHKGPESWCVDKSANTWFFKKDSAKFGSFGDLGIHKIDLMMYLLTKEAKSVYSMMKTLDKKFPDGSMIEVDDNSVTIIEFTDGTFGTINTSWTNYGNENNTTYIYLEKGVMKLYVDKDHPLVIEHSDGKVETFDLGAIQTNDNQTSSGVIDLFIESIKTGKPSVLDAKEILKSMEVVFAGIKSAEIGKPVLIK